MFQHTLEQTTKHVFRSMCTVNHMFLAFLAFFCGVVTLNDFDTKENVVKWNQTVAMNATLKLKLNPNALLAWALDSG